jgi:parallel beta-helix repeat protein
MLMQSKATAAAVALGGALTLFAGPAMAKSPLTTVHCGQTLTQSVKLANDLTNCPAPGLAIGADAVTVDLNGHTIDGTVTQTDTCQVLPFGTPGIDTGGHNGLTIKNGTVQQFLNGIAVGPGEFEGTPTVGMANSVVRNITARDNSFVGIAIEGDHLTFGNRIEHNVVTGTRCDAGIEMHGTHANRIADNRSTDNGGTGIFVIGLDHSAIEDNRVSGNGGGGMLSGRGSDNVIRRNSVAGAPEDAIHVFDAGDAITANHVTDGIGGIVVEGFDSAANQVSRNRVSGTADGIVVFANATVVSDNLVASAVGGCDGCGSGILIGAGSANRVTRNIVQRTLLDGIHVIALFAGIPTADTMVGDNVVRDASGNGVSVATEGDGPVTGTLLQRNVATGAGTDGFDVRAAATTLTANAALRNGALGIEAVAGVTDGGHNVARGNGNPAQCVGVVCR